MLLYVAMLWRIDARVLVIAQVLPKRRMDFLKSALTLTLLTLHLRVYLARCSSLLP